MIQPNLDISLDCGQSGLYGKVVFILRGQRQQPVVHQLDLNYIRKVERAALKSDQLYPYPDGRLMANGD